LGHKEIQLQAAGGIAPGTIPKRAFGTKKSALRVQGKKKGFRRRRSKNSVREKSTGKRKKEGKKKPPQFFAG